MDRCERQSHQRRSLRSARGRCGNCSGRQLQAHDGSRRSGSTGNLRSTAEHREVRRVQRTGRGPESGSGDSEGRRGYRPLSRWSRRDVPGRILLVHGLGCDFNCDKIFNLFCLYGNVVAVKILRDKQVLVELNDVQAAKRCVSNLHCLPLNGTDKLKVKYSKHWYIYDNRIVKKLSDGTPAQKNYATSIFNRFPRKNTYINWHRIAAPSKILHFFNAPLDISASKMQKAVTNALGRKDAVRSITILSQKHPDAQCLTGLIEMKSIDLAVKTILLLNHMTFESSRSRFPFQMKICFSKWSEIRQKSDESSTLICRITPQKPWLLHKSEYAMSTKEFPVSLMISMTDGDYRWTLWDMRERVTEAVDPESGSPVETVSGSAIQATVPAVNVNWITG